MKKLFILQLFLSVLTVSPLFADVVPITIDFEDETSFTPPTKSGIYRFKEGQYKDFYFGNSIGILEKEVQEQHRGYYLGNAPGSNYVGYSNNNSPVTITRVDGDTFSFVGGYFTPANFTQGWVSLEGFVGEVPVYRILLDIQLLVEPKYYNLEKDECLDLLTGEVGILGVKDITKLVIAPYGWTPDDWKEEGDWWKGWIPPINTQDIQTKRNHQIVMDNLTFLIGEAKAEGTSTPEPAAITVLGLGMIGLLASRRKRKNT